MVVERQVTEIERAACERKVNYRTKAEARDKASVRSRGDGVALYPYECPVCSRWHLTRMAPEVYRAARRAARGPP
jgi:hypothetical protein